MKLIIDIPDEVYKAVQNGSYCGSLYEELQSAIPYEPKGDLISREALKKALKSNCDTLCNDKNTNWCEHCCPLNDFEDLIDNAPTIKTFTLADIEEQYRKGLEKGLSEWETERPQGEWIMQRHDLDGCFYTCSNCGRMIRVPLFIDDPEDNETLADYPFCHCGAKMKGGKE